MFTGIVLAGGKSKRMGSPKAFLKLHGRPLIQYPLDVLKPFCSEIFIVTQTPEIFRDFDVKILSDTYTEAGPMGGIFTGLQNAENHWSIVLPCDMPYLRQELIQGLLKQIGAKFSLEAIVPVSLDKNSSETSVQPLCALYSKNCLPLLYRKIKAQEVSLISVLTELETCFVHWLKLDPEDNAGISFTNLNTPLDLEEAKHKPPWKVIRQGAFC